MIGDPNAVAPLFNSSALYGYGPPIGDAIFMIDTLGNFFEHHLPGMQAYNLDVAPPDPTVVPWLGLPMGARRDGGVRRIDDLPIAAGRVTGGGDAHRAITRQDVNNQSRDAVT